MAPAPSSPADLDFPPLPPLPYTTRHQSGHGIGRSFKNSLLMDQGESSQNAGRSKDPSFAEATRAKGERKFPPIQLAARQYGSKDGKPAISFSPAELQVGVDNLKHSLVAKFSGGRPPIEEVRRSFLHAWGLKGACSIGAWDARHILIVLESEADARLVLAHPCRKIDHSLFRVFRWSVDFDSKKEPSTATTWVRLMNLPPQLYNPGYMMSIVSSFALFLAVDNRTASFSNPSFARVCIELDFAKPPPDQVWISTGPQEGFWLKLIYENNLCYCSKCRLHGHNLETCRKVIHRREEEQWIRSARVDPVGKPKGAYTQPPLDDKQEQQDNRPAALPDSGNQGWTVVQKRKQKKKSKKDMSLSLTTFRGKQQQTMEMENQTCNTAAADKEGEARAITCQLQTSCSVGDLSKEEGSLKSLDQPSGPAMEKNPTKDGPVKVTQTNTSSSSSKEDMERIAKELTEQVNGDEDVPSLAMVVYQSMADVEHLKPASCNADDGLVTILVTKDGRLFCKELADRLFQDMEEMMNYAKDKGYALMDVPSTSTEEPEKDSEVSEVIHISSNESCDQVSQTPTIASQGKNRHRNKKKTRSSARNCPKNKDPNYVWP